MRWHWAVPGPLAQYTGGYRYDAEVVSGLRARGVALDVHALAGRHPDADGSIAHKAGIAPTEIGRAHV